MTTEVEAPVVQWRGGQLVGQDGSPLTSAQDAKATRYLTGGHIHLRGASGGGSGWGTPWTETATYDLTPIPGCRQVRVVTVRSHYATDGNLTGRDYMCDCQRARGTSRTDAGTCSHVMAVHAYLNGGAA